MIKKIVVGILSLESRLIVRRYEPFIVAVTGSVGKTSTKDAIYDVLKEADSFVRKSEKSLNSDIGLPLTIIGVPNAWYSLSGWLHNINAGLELIVRRRKYPHCLILEIGADHPGDIRKVAKWLRPNVAVLTKVSRTPVHVEFFKSPEEVFEEKASLAMSVRKGGTLVLFADDAKVMTLADRVKGRDVSVVSYGFSEGAAVRGSNFQTVYEGSAPAGISFDLSMDGAPNAVTVRGVLGKAHIYSLLSAAAVGLVRGMDPFMITKALDGYEAPKGRMNVVAGINGSTVIDDTYNSSPDAASSALELLKSLNCAGSKIAILGDMMELGKYAGDEHRKIGREAVGAVDKLITIGQRSKLTAEEAVRAGFPGESVQSFDSANDAIEHIRSRVDPGDIVLVKGSQSMRMERISAALLREPEKAAKLLVRQDKEWLAKA